jgi:hypothetical protein
MTENQPSLFDAAQARDEAIEQVAAHTPPAWSELAWDTIVTYLKTHAEFFVDDFWSETGIEEPPEARALGAVVRRAQREGLMEKSGQFRPSVRSHLTVKPVWRSLIRGT